MRIIDSMQLNFTVLSTLVVIATMANGYDIFTEMREEVEWPYVRAIKGANFTEIDCYSQIDIRDIGHTFRLNARKITESGYRCIIQLPTPVDVHVSAASFADPKDTFVRVITGNSRTRPILWSSMVTADNVDAKNAFTLQCLYGYLIISNASPEDWVAFKLVNVNENAPVITESMCTKKGPHDVLRERRELENESFRPDSAPQPERRRRRKLGYLEAQDIENTIARYNY